MEEVEILKLNVDGGAKTLADLKNNIRELKKELDTLEVGTKDYANTLQELQDNQYALRNAMHATAESEDEQSDKMAQTARAAQGLGTSYNALVRQMALLDEQFRSTEDEVRRAELGTQIKLINDQLKEMDAARGKFGRNVGDYFNQMSASIKDVIKDFPPSLNNIKQGLDNVTKSMGLMSKNPLFGIASLLAPIINNITAGLKDSDTALKAVKKISDALKPVADFFAGLLEKIAGWLSQAVDYVLKLGEESGIEFNKIVSGAAGVGNAILQFILTPIRNTIDGAKAMGNVFSLVFKGQFKEAAKSAKQAVKEIGENFKKGFDFKGNFEAGQQAGESFVKGLQSTKFKKAAKKAGKSILDEIMKGLTEDLDLNLQDAAEVWENAQSRMLASAKKGEQLRLDYLEQGIRRKSELAELEISNDRELAARQYEIEKEGMEQRMGLLQGFYKDAVARGDLDTALEYDQQIQDLQYEIALAGYKRKKELRQQEIQDFITYAGVVSNVFNSIADIFEESGEQDEKSAKKAKFLRSASAIIDTISGAIGAYMQTVKTMPAPWNIPVAAANAGAVLAAGYAQVKQINAVKVGDSAEGAAVAAPTAAFSPVIQQVRNVTGQREEERLYQNQRVFLVYSDLEIANTAQRVKVRETEF